MRAWMNSSGHRANILQGRFRVSRYQFRHGLYQGGQSAVLKREVFERGTAAAVLPYDPRRDEVVLIRQFRAGSYVAGRHPFTWEIVAGIIEDAARSIDERLGNNYGEYARKAADVVEIDEIRRPHEAEIHERHETLPAREHLRLVAVLAERR